MFKIRPIRAERNFIPFIEGLGEVFVHSIMDVYMIHFNEIPEASENTYWCHLQQFLQFVCESPNTNEFRRFARGEVTLSYAEIVVVYQHLLFAYRNHLHKQDVENRSKNNSISFVRRFVTHNLANAGVAPHNLYVKGFVFENKVGQGSVFTDAAISDNFNVDSLLKEHSSLLNIEGLGDAKDDIRELLKNILLEFEDADIGSHNLADLAALTLSVRIESIEKHCAKIILDYKRKMDLADEWTNNPVYIKASDCLHDLLINGTNHLTRTDEKRGLIEGLDVPLLLATYLNTRFGGRPIPKRNDGKNHSRFRELYRHAGLTVSDFQCYVIKHKYFNPEYRDKVESALSSNEYLLRCDAIDEYWSRSVIGGGMHANLTEKYSQLLADDINYARLLIVWCKRYNQGSYPREVDDAYPAFSGRRSEWGVQVSDIHDHLGQTNRLLAAISAFIQFKVAGNSDSIRLLKTDALVETSEDGTYQLSWIKTRKGKNNNESEIIVHRSTDMPLTTKTLSVVDVFHVALKARRGWESQGVAVRHTNNLFLGNNNSNARDSAGRPVGKSTTPVQNTFNQHFKSIVQEITGGVWTTTMKAIRGSILLLTGIVSKDMYEVMKKGRHTTLAMPQKYTHHLPAYLKREENLREFLAWFEALTTINIENFAEKIGIDPSFYDAQVAKIKIDQEQQKLLDQQFGGIHCSNPYQGIQEGTQEGETCHRIDACVTCKNRRNFFVMTHENVLGLLQWNQVLGLIIDESDTKINKWGMWQVFTGMMISKLENAREHRTLLNRAKQALHSETNPYERLIPTIQVQS